jgi:hypothetical protein
MKEVVIELKVEGANEAQKSVDELVTSLENLQSVGESGFDTGIEDIGDEANEASGKVDKLTKSVGQNSNVSRQAQAVSRTLTGSFKLATTAFAAFGVQNEQVAQTLLRVQAASQFAGGLRDLSRGVKTLSGSFNILGVAMKAVPFIAIAAAVLGVLQASGALQPILKALGSVFNTLLAPVKLLIDGFTSLIGATEDVEKSSEAAKSAVDDLSSSFDKLDRNRDKLTRRYSEEERLIQNQINLLRTQGATAEEIAKKEDELLNARINTSSTRIAEEKINLLTQLGLGEGFITSNDNQLKQLIKQQIAAKTAGIANQKDRDEAITKLQQKFDEQFNKLLKARADRDDATVALEIARLERQKTARDKANQDVKNAQDKANKDKDKSDREREKAERERERLIKETTNNIIKSLVEESKAIEENNKKQLDILKQSLIEGKITDETFNAEKVLLEKKTNDEIIQLRSNFQLTKEQIELIGTENEKLIQQKNSEEIIKNQRENADIELALVKKTNQEKVKQTKQDADDRIETLDREFLQKKIELLNNEELNEVELAERLKLLELEKAKAKLETLQIGSIEYLTLKQQIAEQERAIDKKTADDAMAAQESTAKFTLELANTTISSLTTLSDIYFQNRLAKAKGNAKEEEKIAKKQFQVNKALQLSTAIITGIGATLEAYKNGMKNPIPLLGPATAGVYAAIAASVSAINIAKIASTKFQPSGGSSGSAPTAPSTPSLNTAGGLQPTSFAPATFGSGISQSQTFGGQQGSGGNVLRAYVSETDLTETQRRLRNIRSAGQL